MPTRKIRVEVFDEEGNRYTLAFEGQVTREKAVRLLDVVELLGAIPNADRARSLTLDRPLVSKYQKACSAVESSLSLGWFSSKDLQGVFEKEFQEPMSLSTAATYLSRMCEKGLLTRGGLPNKLRYRSVQTTLEIKARTQQSKRPDGSKEDLRHF